MNSMRILESPMLALSISHLRSNNTCRKLITGFKSNIIIIIYYNLDLRI
jgi:hypothetical protein